MKLVVKRPHRVNGTIKVGGDKSITHRALMLSAIARGKSVLRGYSQCADCRATLDILGEVGVSVKKEGRALIINGNGTEQKLKEPRDVLDCKNSGTTMRLFTGILSGQNFFSVLTGDTSLRRRPMERVVLPLEKMGAKIMGRNEAKYAPLAVQGGDLKAIDYTLPVPSAQVKSSILFAGLFADDDTIIREKQTTRDHTERLLEFFDCALQRESGVIRLMDRYERLVGKEVSIPGDLSSAAFIIGLSAGMEKSEINIQEVGVNPTRLGFVSVLKKMGARIVFENRTTVSNEPRADIIVKGSELKAVALQPEDIPGMIDEVPIFAVLATRASGTSIVRGAEELRIKETDRIAAIVRELKKMGADIEEQKDGFIVNGPVRLKGAVVESWGDHRIAMALTIAGFYARGTTVVQHAECISISFPEFIDTIRRVCGEECIGFKD